MIGHGLLRSRRPAGDRAWDRWIAAGFAVGSACFFIGPFPGFVELVGQGADGVVFFSGSIFFTLAAGLELRMATIRREQRVADASWWSAAIQFAGTLLFNLSTFHAMKTSLSTHQQNRLVWAPDVLGSACFLVSGALAYGVTTGPHLLPASWLPAQSDPEWRMAAINLLGCILFGVSAIASFVVPSTGSILALAPANWGTALGALCFFIGALLLWRQTPSEPGRAAGPVVSEVA